MMGYRKDEAEAEWRKEWEPKERELRKAGWTKKEIQKLKDFEWRQFNSDRRFYEHGVKYGQEYVERAIAQPPVKEIKTVEDLFDAIEDEYAYRELKKERRELWLFILLLVNDYKVEEAAKMIGISKGEIFGDYYRYRNRVRTRRKINNDSNSKK